MKYQGLLTREEVEMLIYEHSDMHYFKTLFLKIGFYYRRLAGSFALLLLIYIQSETEIPSSTPPLPQHNGKTSVTMKTSCS